MLKGRVTHRDGDISKLQLQLDRMEKERRMLRNEIRGCKLAHQHIRSELLEKKKENDLTSKSLQVINFVPYFLTNLTFILSFE